MASDPICLKQLEEPYIFHSNLILPNRKGTRYCVIAENCFIIFKNTTDSMSLYRVPLNKNTRLNIDQKSFNISRYDYSFTFCHERFSLISQWTTYINEAINSENSFRRNSVMDFHAEIVHIDKIGRDCPIVFGKTDFRLVIYESYEYQRADISRHILNLKLYQISGADHQGSSSNVLTLRSSNDKLKFTFKTAQLAKDWKLILESMNSKISNIPSNISIINEIYENTSNKLCADCGAIDPQWVSINMCVTLCENCVGRHRGLGTAISRTQSIILDERCWEDPLLIRLFLKIGNENANKFWNKNSNQISSTTATITERKYKKREFIDNIYLSLKEEELVAKLSLSVATDDIIETMRLWFSNTSNYSKETVNNLMNIARNSKQMLQEKFLSLQGNISNSTEERTEELFVGEFHLSYNNSDKLSSLYLVHLYKDKIVIKVENIETSIKKLIDICVIFLNSINMVLFEPSLDSLQISIYPQGKFLLLSKEKNKKDSLNISDLRIFDSSKKILPIFKSKLFELLYPNDFDLQTELISLFIYTDVQINADALLRCKCCLTLNEIAFFSPINTIYDLTMAEEIKMDDDKKGFITRVSRDVVHIVGNNCQDTIFRCFEKSSKTRLLSLDNELTSKKLEELINYLKFFGIHSEGIFQIYGTPQNIENLFLMVADSTENLNIETKYTVDDVSSCLKKCLNHLMDPLIAESLFNKFKNAVCMENDDDTFSCCMETIKLLPNINYKILRHLIELMFIISYCAESNKMDSESLASEISSYIFSRRKHDCHDLKCMVKYFIDRFVTLFDYPEEEQLNLLIFLGKRKNPSLHTVMQMFLINPSLRSSINSQNVKDIEEISLQLFGNDTKFSSVLILINNYEFVQDLQSYLFEDPVKSKVKLWHFIHIKGGTFKRLLYRNDKFTNRHTFPENYVDSKTMDHLIFMQNECAETFSEDSAESHTFIVKFGNNKHELVISSDSLKIFRSCTNWQVLKLSEIILYRAHKPGKNVIYMISPDRSDFRYKFLDFQSFKEFLFYFDIFRSKINF